MRKDEPIRIDAGRRRDPLPTQYRERILRLAEELYNNGRGIVIIQKSRADGGNRLHISSYDEGA